MGNRKRRISSSGCETSAFRTWDTTCASCCGAYLECFAGSTTTRHEKRARARAVSATRSLHRDEVRALAVGRPCCPPKNPSLSFSRREEASPVVVRLLPSPKDRGANAPIVARAPSPRPRASRVAERRPLSLSDRLPPSTTYRTILFPFRSFPWLPLLCSTSVWRSPLSLACLPPISLLGTELPRRATFPRRKSHVSEDLKKISDSGLPPPPQTPAGRSAKMGFLHASERRQAKRRRRGLQLLLTPVRQ